MIALGEGPEDIGVPRLAGVSDRMARPAGVHQQDRQPSKVDSVLGTTPVAWPQLIVSIGRGSSRSPTDPSRREGAATTHV